MAEETGRERDAATGLCLQSTGSGCWFIGDDDLTGAL